MPLEFGVHVPTCVEGLMHPVPFARAEDLVSLALLAERLGFDSVWGNDHMTTQRYVQREFEVPPRYYEPLITFAYIAARTTRLKVGTCVLVLPMRHVAVAAKQVATLDQLSGGRVILGVGTGAYREEYEALFPDARDVHRGQATEESIRALRLLFTERRVTFRGRYVRLEGVECFPKPLQDPLPIYVGGNHAEVRRRVGELGDGWLPSVLLPDEIRAGIEDVRRAAEKARRDPARIAIAPQFAVAIARTSEEARRRFRASQLYRHFESLRSATLRGQVGRYEDRNLVGSPDEICERIRAYADAGVTALPGMTFVADTVDEMRDGIELFGREVLPNVR